MKDLSDIKNARGNPLYTNQKPLGEGFKSKVLSVQRNPTFTFMGVGRKKGEVAIKRPLHNPEAQKELSHEATIYKRLGRHENILRLYDNHQKNPSYLVMEQAGITALSAVNKVKNDKNLSCEKKNKIYCAFAGDMVAALLYSRSKKVLQNDAHTENYVLKDGRLKIIDFGSSKISTEPYFPLQDPKRFEGVERNPKFDYHPIDAVIRILDKNNTSQDVQDIINILRTIGQDISTKDKNIKTDEDIINAQTSTDAEKKQAHHDISRKMKDVILRLKEIRASPHDIKTYFDRVVAQEKRQDKVKSHPIDFDKQ